MNWRPIKTAPKKWERVDLWTAKGKRVTDAEWNTYKRQWESRRVGDSVDRDGGWVVVRNPTHWMPIPPPPVVKESLTPALPTDDNLDEPLGPAPTHWMPLPPPPAVTQSLTVPLDDDLNEPLGPACSRENPECESCQ